MCNGNIANLISVFPFHHTLYLYGDKMSCISSSTFVNYSVGSFSYLTQLLIPFHKPGRSSRHLKLHFMDNMDINRRVYPKEFIVPYKNKKKYDLNSNLQFDFRTVVALLT